MGEFLFLPFFFLFFSPLAIFFSPLGSIFIKTPYKTRAKNLMWGQTSKKQNGWHP
jgi:hypothetical protein